MKNWPSESTRSIFRDIPARSIIHIFVTVFLVSWAVGCDGQKPSENTKKIIKIGIIAPLTGPDRTKGIEGLKGMQTGIFMQSRLDNGASVKLIQEDDGGDPALAARALKKLSEKDKVSAIVTFSGTSSVLAMAQAADAYKTPIVAAVATNPNITRGNNFISQLCFDDYFQGTVAALYARDELLVDRAAVFRNPASEYSSYLASVFKSKFESIGGVVVDYISLDENTKNLSKIINDLHSKAPELLYLPVTSQELLHIAEQLHRENWKPTMMGSDGLISTLLDLHPNQLRLVEGMLATDFFAKGMPLTPFGKKAEKIHKGLDTTYAALGIEGYAIVFNSLNKCGDPKDRECVNQMIRKTTNFTGITGKITIGADGKAQRPLCICAIEGGRSKFIVKVY